MDYDIVISLIAALVNCLFSLLVPCMLNKTNNELLDNIREFFDIHKNMLLTSSLVTGLMVYMSLKAVPSDSMAFLNTSYIL